MPTGPIEQLDIRVPSWVPEGVHRYLAHVESGRSIRGLAREAGCHASTILRQVRKYETRRDDLLIDLAMRRLKDRHLSSSRRNGRKEVEMAENSDSSQMLPDETTLRAEAPRILRRLNEKGACLAIARDMEKAVVVREGANGQSLRTAVLSRALAEAMALKDWISVAGDGRITRYKITGAGRMALKRFLAEDEAARVGTVEGADPYQDQHREWSIRADGTTSKRRGIRYNAAESPLSALSRRKDKEGKPFLSPELVAAGERLREDFELAQMGPRITQNWDRFLTGAGRGDFASGDLSGSSAARERVGNALSELGPGLGDVVLRCCCFLEGMEAVEQRMGWSARSGKIVLRIALHRLWKFYDEKQGNWSPMIG